MRTIFIILLLFLLAACVADAPQVTVTSEVTVTLLPLTATAIPTPTLYPQFVTLQDQIAASGERFDLLPDGTIQETIPDGVKVVPGLSVDKNGQIKLMVDGQEIVIASTDVTFDDDRGVIVERYSFDQQKNEWLPAVGPNLIVDLGGGLSASQENLTVSFENGAGVKFGFTEQGLLDIKDGCQKLVWFAYNAGEISNGHAYTSFDEYLKRATANGGVLEKFYDFKTHSVEKELGVGEVNLIPSAKVDISRCQIAFHEPGNGSYKTKPSEMPNAVMLPGVWIQLGTTIDGSIKIDIAPNLNKEVFKGFPFVNQEMKPDELVVQYNKTIALVLQDLDNAVTISPKSWQENGEIVMTPSSGSDTVPYRIVFTNISITKYDVSAFFEKDPGSGSRWLIGK